MTNRILTLFFLLAALMLPASAAARPHHHKHPAARARKSKSVRKAVRPHSKSVASRKRAARARRQKLAKR